MKLLLYVLIESNNILSTILIAELGGGAPWVHMHIPEPTGACSRPAGGLKHACVMHVVTKCKSSAVQWIPLYPIPLVWNDKIKQLAIITAF